MFVYLSRGTQSVRWLNSPGAGLEPVDSTRRVFLFLLPGGAGCGNCLPLRSWETSENLAAHRRSNLLSRSRGMSITSAPGWSSPRSQGHNARGPLKVPAQSRWNNPWDASLVVGSRRPRWSVARHGTRRNRPLDPGGAVLRARGCAVADTPAQINFDAPAVLRKWPSVNNERLTNTWPYLAAEGTLDDCTREFMSKPVSQRHLYEIHTAPQGELITAVLSAEQIIELARLRDFL